MGGVAGLMARTLAYCTLVPRGVLAPVIMVFCVIGTFTASGNPYDVGTMVVMGVIGYFAHKYNFSPAGILLGVILGPIAEQGYRNMMTLTDGNPIPFLAGRPVSLILIAMIIGALYFSLRPKKWETAEHEYEAMNRDLAEVTDD